MIEGQENLEPIYGPKNAPERVHYRTVAGVRAEVDKKALRKHSEIIKPTHVSEMLLVFDGKHKDVDPQSFSHVADVRSFNAERRMDVDGIDVKPYLGYMTEGKTLLVAKKVGDGKWMTNEVRKRGTDYTNFESLDSDFLQATWDEVTKKGDEQ